MRPFESEDQVLKNIKKKNQKEVLLLLAALFLSSPASAYFLDAAYGVRPAGMGDAFVAVADDGNSVLFNPAGYAELRVLEFSGMYSSLYSGLNPGLYTGAVDSIGYNFISLGMPMAPGLGLGLSWLQLHSVFYQENTVALSLGSRMVGLDPFPLDLGVNVKLLNWQVAANDYSTDPNFYPSATRGQSAFGGDLGAQAEIAPSWRVGLALDNVLPAKLGLSQQSALPLSVRAGTAYLYKIGQGALDSVLASLELCQRSGLWNARAGAESRLFNGAAALRFGANADEVTAGLGLVLPNKPLGLQLDYAFSYPLQVIGTGGSHRLGITVRWEPQAQAKKRRKVKRRKLPSSQPLPSQPLLPAQLRPPVPSNLEPEPARPTATEHQYAPEPTPGPSEPIPEPGVENPNNQKAAPDPQQPVLQAELDYFNEKLGNGLLAPIVFKPGQAKVLNSSQPALDYLGEILGRYPDFTVKIIGHADAKTPGRGREALGEKRAESVQGYLLGHFPQLSEKQLLIEPARDRGTSAKGKPMVEFEIAGPLAAE